MKYPKSKKVNKTDNYFGTKVADPYRWLEDENSTETKKWVKTQNKVTFDYLDKIPYRTKVNKELKKFVNYERYLLPQRAGEYIFFYKNSGLQDQSVIYFQKGLSGQARVFLDPNKLGKDGTVHVELGKFSKDKKYANYTVSTAGSDWTSIHVIEVASKKVLTDRVSWVKAWAGAAWKDNGFYYPAYTAPKKGKELTERNENQKVYYHKLGDPQKKDKLVFEDPKHPLRYLYPDTTRDERFMVIYVTEGTEGQEVYYKDLEGGQKDFKLLFKGFKNNYEIIDNIGDKLLVKTDNGAPKYKVVLVDPKNPTESNWEEIIPEGRDTLIEATFVGGKIITQYLKDAITRVYQFSLDGNAEREITLPGLGFAGGFEGEHDDKFIFYTFSSFNYPSTIFKYDLKSGVSTFFKKVKLNFDVNFQVKEIFYESRDGTRIPMFLVHKQGLKLNSQNPVFLYAYGGFNVSMGPFFSPFVSFLVNRGFVYALPIIRGGGEYGEDWHKAGMLEKKQNVFDDFAAAAEYLIKQKYTSSSKIAISGGSNGGLLVGASITQRPDLFKVALPAVGVLDMLRFQKFTVGWGWVVEYGASDNKKQFSYLLKYSPLHNVKEIEYPATLITTADHDDRVVPAHSFKFAATLQEKNRSENPVLIRIETKAGHGGTNALSKKIETFTDEFCFAAENLGVEI